MKERPILFGGPMVRAVLTCAKCGRISASFPCSHCGSVDFLKTQTRRVVKGVPEQFNEFHGFNMFHEAIFFSEEDGVVIKCPYGKPGDRLGVKETHYRYGEWVKNGITKTGRQKWKFKPLSSEIHYCTDDVSMLDIQPSTYRKAAWYKRPSIFLPKDFIRLWLEITDIRVERLQEISEEDAKAEFGYDMGIWYKDYSRPGVSHNSAIPSFATLWDSINGKTYPWKDNPWVWAVTFKRIKP